MNVQIRLLFFAGITLSSLSGQVSGGAPSPLTSVPPTPKWVAGATPAAGTMVTGTVKMDDGSALPGSVSIQIVCSGSERTVAHTTVADDFGFQWDGVPQVSATGSNGAGGNASSSFTSLSNSNSDAAASVRGGSQSEGNYCDLRAEYGGYSSTVVNLNNPMAFDGTDIGVIWLHRASGHQSNSVSISTLRAPKDALRDFDKGMELMAADKLTEAAASFEKAVEVYPQFAQAWLSLGKIQFKQKSNDAALASLQKAMDLDSKIAGTWQVLGYMAVDQGKWTDAARYLNQAVRLDPINSTLSWFFDAVADYHLQRFDEAERCIRAEMALDTQARNGRAQYLLGLILIARDDFAGGTEMLRNYLASSPDPQDVGPAKSMLARVQPLSVVAAR